MQITQKLKFFKQGIKLKRRDMENCRTAENGSRVEWLRDRRKYGSKIKWSKDIHRNR